MINVGHNEWLIADAGEREGREPLDERDETTPGRDEQEEDAGQGAHHREGVGNHWWLSSPYLTSSSLIGGSSQRGSWQSLVISISLRNHQNAGWKAHHWGELAIIDDCSSSPSYESSSLTNMIIISGKYSSLTGLATMDFSSETANSAHSSSSSQVLLLISK